MKKLNTKQLKNVNGGILESDFPNSTPYDSFTDYADNQSRQNEKSTHRWLNDRMRRHNH